MVDWLLSVCIINESPSGSSKLFCSILFSLFLLYDFNLIRTQELGSNDWGTAMRMAFILYLDIINLLLEILEAMGD